MRGDYAAGGGRWEENLIFTECSVQGLSNFRARGEEKESGGGGKPSEFFVEGARSGLQNIFHEGICGIGSEAKAEKVGVVGM